MAQSVTQSNYLIAANRELQWSELYYELHIPKEKVLAEFFLVADRCVHRRNMLADEQWSYVQLHENIRPGPCPEYKDSTSSHELYCSVVFLYFKLEIFYFLCLLQHVVD